MMQKRKEIFEFMLKMTDIGDVFFPFLAMIAVFNVC